MQDTKYTRCPRCHAAISLKQLEETDIESTIYQCSTCLTYLRARLLPEQNIPTLLITSYQDLKRISELTINS